MNTLSALQSFAAATNSAGGTKGNMWFMIIYIVFFGAIIYFLFIRPTRKQSAQQEEMMSSLKPGDSVMTTSGFYGTVIGIEDDTVIVEFGNNKNCRIPMHKKAIADVESKKDSYAESSDSDESAKADKKSKKK